LPAGEKQAWEERAIKMNEDGGQLKGTTSVGTNATQDVVYECCWDNCDWQFEDMTDCIDHCIAEQNGHVQSSFINAPSGEYNHEIQKVKECRRRLYYIHD
jgi:protein polybromo-1